MHSAPSSHQQPERAASGFALPGTRVLRLLDHLRQDAETGGLDLEGRLEIGLTNVSLRRSEPRERRIGWILSRPGLPELSGLAAHGWTNPSRENQRDSALVDRALERYRAQLKTAAGMTFVSWSVAIDIPEALPTPRQGSDRPSPTADMPGVEIPPIDKTIAAALRLWLAANESAHDMSATISTNALHSQGSAWHRAGLMTLARYPDGQLAVVGAQELALALDLPRTLFEQAALAFTTGMLELFRGANSAEFSMSLQVARPSAHEVLAARAFIDAWASGYGSAQP